MRAYWFFGDTLRDGRPIPPNGEWLIHEGEIELCKSGLHASVHPLDALTYAPGPNLALVELRGDIQHGNDKCVAQQRRIIKRFDATELLLECSRQFALDVIHLWDAPPVVRQYLETGDVSLRGKARAAAREAAAEAAAWAARTAQRDYFLTQVEARFSAIN